MRLPASYLVSRGLDAGLSPNAPRVTAPIFERPPAIARVKVGLAAGLDFTGILEDGENQGADIKGDKGEGKEDERHQQPFLAEQG